MVGRSLFLYIYTILINKPHNMVDHKTLNDTELVKNQRNVLEKYMNRMTDWKLRDKKRVLALYDQHINADNIRMVINEKIKVILVALIEDKIELLTTK